MNDHQVCQRCKLPIVGTRYSFRVDADPPLPLANPVEISLCTSCLESMQRWMERRQRRSDSSSPEPEVATEAASSSSSSSRSEKSRKKHKKGRSRYDDQLQKAERWLRIRTAATISALVIVFVVLFVLIAVEMAGFNRGRPGPSNPAEVHAPPMPTVDPSNPK